MSGLLNSWLRYELMRGLSVHTSRGRLPDREGSRSRLTLTRRCSAAKSARWQRLPEGGEESSGSLRGRRLVWWRRSDVSRLRLGLMLSVIRWAVWLILINFYNIITTVNNRYYKPTCTSAFGTLYLNLKFYILKTNESFMQWLNTIL